MKLNTRTSKLSSSQRRQLVEHVIDWMKINIGEKKSKERTFKYKVIKLGDEYTPAYGCYDPTINTLCVFHNFCPTVKWIIISVLHEYTHYLQNLRYYHDTLKKVGYENHPDELHAGMMEGLYQWVWEDISPLINS